MRSARLLLCLVALPAAGCMSEVEREPSMRQRQDDLMRDPFGYDPQRDAYLRDSEYRVSGSDDPERQRELLRRDLESVLMP